MPERFEIYIVYEKRYINTLPFVFFFLCWYGCQQFGSENKGLVYDARLVRINIICVVNRLKPRLHAKFANTDIQIVLRLNDVM